MKNSIYLLSILMLISCSEKQSANTDSDFTDKIVTFATNNPDGQYLELPELYNATTDYIPEDKDEHVILAEKLKSRGFKQTDFSRNNYQLLGRRIVKITLVKADCECEVDKIYYTTGNVSQFIRSERIKCDRIQPK